MGWFNVMMINLIQTKIFTHLQTLLSMGLGSNLQGILHFYKILILKRIG